MNIEIISLSLGFLVSSKLLSSLMKTHWFHGPIPLLPKNPHSYIYEICISDFISAVAAVNGGCTSLEVCSDRPQGGITPSLGLVEALVCSFKNNVEIHVLIRPRPGDFNYSDDEFDIILRDIKAFKRAGVDGIVVGILQHDKTVDMRRMKIIREATRGTKLTFHRAFDTCIKPELQLQCILDLNCDRLLTSGRATGAYDGRKYIYDMVKSINDKGSSLKIVAAAGVNHINVREIITDGYSSSSCPHGVHAGSSVCVKFVDEIKSEVYMGSVDEAWELVSEEKVLAIGKLIESSLNVLKLMNTENERY